MLQSGTKIWPSYTHVPKADYISRWYPNLAVQQLGTKIWLWYTCLSKRLLHSATMMWHNFNLVSKPKLLQSDKIFWWCSNGVAIPHHVRFGYKNMGTKIRHLIVLQMDTTKPGPVLNAGVRVKTVALVYPDTESWYTVWVIQLCCCKFKISHCQCSRRNLSSTQTWAFSAASAVSVGT